MRCTFYLLVSLVLSLLPSLLIAQEKVLNQKNLQIRNGLYFKVNTRDPFTGEAFYEKYDNGQWKQINNFNKGKIIGSETFYENGQTEVKVNITNGKQSSEYFYTNGKLRHRKSTKNNDPIGKWQWFDSQGNILKEIKYGKLDGIVKILDEDQKLVSEINYRDGKRHGKTLHYYNNNIYVEH